MKRDTPTPLQEADESGFAVRVTQSAKSVAAKVLPVSSGATALLFGVVMFLVTFGMVMVFAASSVDSVRSEQGLLSVVLRQGLFTFFGIPLMLVAARMKESFYRRLAIWGVILGIGLQSLVFTPLGDEYGGNRNWIRIGDFVSIQPSEFVKLALAVWIGYVLSRKGAKVREFIPAWIPVAPVAILAIGLVMLGRDFGTVVIMVALVFGAMFIAGVKIRHLVAPLVVVAAVAVPIVLSSPSRVRRIQHFFDGCTEAEYYAGCWQQLHGTWAMSGGGVLGVGLGNSRAKWNWLPEADSDYIFAIIAEELGLIGAITVLALYAVMTYAFIRIIREATSQFTKIVTGAIMVWIVGQAFVNIAVVLGLLPVLGVPLPLVSAGGSQTLATLLAIGVVLALARSDRQSSREGDTPEDVMLAVRAEGRA